jgi:outer membrane protein OmpA-like peptidoglycan-associated protein
MNAIRSVFHTAMQHKFRARGATALLALAFALVCVFPDAAQAQQNPSETQIRDALKPKAANPGEAGQGVTRGLTRSLGAPAAKPDHSGLVRSLAAKPTRAITVEERASVAEIAKTKPQIDLEINFDYNSDQVKPQSLNALVALGRALSSPEFAGGIFLINGHTDGSGSPEYNEDLSQRRAESVKRLLIEQFGLKPQTLVAVGFGYSQLKNARDPFAAENRRVQVVNTEVR